VLSLCELVLFLEGFLNTISGLLLTFFPAFCMETQGLPHQDKLANANLAQFGSLVLLLGVVGLGCQPTRPLVEALLIGDIVWLWVFYFQMEEHGLTPNWTFGTHFSIWIVVFLASVRTIFLFNDSYKLKRK